MAASTKSRPAQAGERPTTSSDWDKHRGIIERLYIDQDMSLSTVIGELKEAYGFIATERQFKRRISSWRLDKNIKDDEMRAIIATETTRLRQGKQSVFYVRHRQVDPMKIKRFARRKRIDRALYTDSALRPLPADVRCITPQRHFVNSEHSLSADIDQFLKEQLQAMQNGHIATRRSSSPLPRPMVEDPPCFESRPEHNFLGSTSGSSTWRDSIARLMEQRKIQLDALAIPKHQSSPHEAITSRAIAPEDVDLDYEHAEMDANGPLDKSNDCRERQSPIYSLNIRPSLDPSGSQLRTFLLRDGKFLVDQGLPDKDCPMSRSIEELDLIPPQSMQYQDRFRRWADLPPPQALDKYKYYEKPIHVDFFSLPYSLRERPVDAFYFHFFTNNTMNLLLPSTFNECLPEMALRNKSLLALLLTYSACHRARLLGYLKPANRVTLWTLDIFPSFRQSSFSRESSTYPSNEELAIAIMLISLHVLDPDAFGVQNAWQPHLSVAQGMYEHRLAALRDNVPIQEDELREFELLSQRFYHINIMNALSKPCRSRPLQPFKCLACHQGCRDHQLMDTLSSTAEIIVGYGRTSSYSSETCSLALLSVLYAWADVQAKEELNSTEGKSAYTLYPLAVAILLLRRIEGYSSHDTQVRFLVQAIFTQLKLMDPYNRGMMPSILFPLFIAGCEADEVAERSLVSNRFANLEKLGLVHVTAARQLMEQAWQTKEPWWKLSKGEYLGQL